MAGPLWPLPLRAIFEQQLGVVMLDAVTAGEEQLERACLQLARESVTFGAVADPNTEPLYLDMLRRNGMQPRTAVAGNRAALRELIDTLESSLWNRTSPGFPSALLNAAALHIVRDDLDREIVEGLLRGKTQRQIADSANSSGRTVARRIKHMMARAETDKPAVLGFVLGRTWLSDPSSDN